MELPMVLKRLNRLKFDLTTLCWPTESRIEEELEERDLTQRSLFLHVFPVEIVLIIADHLALHDRFSLSQTCRAIRRLTWLNWNKRVSRLPREERLEFLTGIAYLMPNRWVCGRCCNLHPAHHKDVPTLSRSKTYEYTITVPGGRSMRLPYRGFSTQYILMHHHIQLALKLSHMGLNGKYLRKLIETKTHTVRVVSRLGEPSTLTLTYTAEPKIVAKRFLLMEQWFFESRRRPIVSFDELANARYDLCPHLTLPTSRSRRLEYIWISRGIMSPTELEDKLIMALTFPGRPIFGHCATCPTDFAILVSRNMSWVIYTAWHDFGAYGSPLDNHWRSQLYDRERNSWRWFKSFKREEGTGGKVRKLYGQV